MSINNPDSVGITIKNNGPAIPFETIATLFDHSRAVTGSQANSLPILRTVLQQQHANVRLIDSGNQSGWIQFEIILPKINEQIKINNKEKLINSPKEEINKDEINKNENLNKNLETKDKVKKNITLENILNSLFLLIISFVAIILILDTFKINIANYFPILIPLLDNLYETLIDIKSFIINLIN